MRKEKADQIPSISSNSKQRNLSPRVSKVVRDFGRGFVEQTLDNFAVPDIQGDRVIMKVSRIRQVSKNRMDITIIFKPVDGDIRVNRFDLSLYDNHQQSFFAEVVNLNTPIYVNYQQVYTLTVRCNRKNFPSMRNIDLRKLNDGNFKYSVNLNL